MSSATLYMLNAACTYLLHRNSPPFVFKHRLVINNAQSDTECTASQHKCQAFFWAKSPLTRPDSPILLYSSVSCNLVGVEIYSSVTFVRMICYESVSLIKDVSQNTSWFSIIVLLLLPRCCLSSCW